MAERHFASDNNAGVHPALLAAIAEANDGHVPGYGSDPYTERAEASVRAMLGEDARVFFAFNGTGANVVALAAALRPHQAVITPAKSHLNVDECGAYERFAGSKLLTVAVHGGKLTPRDVESCLHGIGDPHHVQPAAISISQSTEVGTVYSVEELSALGAACKEHGLFFHLDGARLANAAVALGVDLRAMLVATGVDAFTFGATKNGALFGEAIVFTHDHPALEILPYTRKSGMQLASKMRFVAAQFNALLHDDLWLKNNSPPRCASSPRNSTRCCTTISGSKMPHMQTTWHSSWPRGCARSTEFVSSIPLRRTVSSRRFPPNRSPRCSASEISTSGTPRHRSCAG